jgi:hypothetical protein
VDLRIGRIKASPSDLGSDAGLRAFPGKPFPALGELDVFAFDPNDPEAPRPRRYANHDDLSADGAECNAQGGEEPDGSRRMNAPEGRPLRHFADAIERHRVLSKRRLNSQHVFAPTLLAGVGESRE